MQSYNKTREIQKEKPFFFCISECQDSKLVSLCFAKNFGKAKVTSKR